MIKSGHIISHAISTSSVLLRCICIYPYPTSWLHWYWVICMIFRALMFRVPKWHFPCQQQKTIDVHYIRCYVQKVLTNALFLEYKVRLLALIKCLLKFHNHTHQFMPQCLLCNSELWIFVFSQADQNQWHNEESWDYHSITQTMDS